MAAKVGYILLTITLLSCFLSNAALQHITDGSSRSSRTYEYSTEERGGGGGGGVEIRFLQRERRETEEISPTPTTTTTTTTTTTPPQLPQLPPTNLSKDEKQTKQKLIKKKIYTKKTTTTTTTTTTTAAPTATTTTTTTTTAAGATGVDDGFGVEHSGDENRTGNVKNNNTPPPPPPTTTTTTTTTTKPKEEKPTEEEAEEEEVESDDGAEVEDMEEDSMDPIKDFLTGNTTVDHHRYYRSHTIKGVEEVRQYWVDLDSYERNEMLSDSHRRATTVTLTFEFPFYGHLLRNITIATGGFLFTGDFVHTWLAATQYIAPLMANFDTSLNKNASVKYADNGTSFTVQWKDVPLKDHADAGTFTFQVTLHKNGDIVFTYKEVPMFVTAIVDDQHPVKVGLSDAYIVDRTIFFVRRKTIYEYHKIDMKKKNMIGNWTAILFKALPTCVSMHSCHDCLSQKISFQCQWCESIGRCSNGLDRNRQEWLLNNCQTYNTQLLERCPPTPPTPTPGQDTHHPQTFGGDAAVESLTADKAGGEGGASVGVVVGVVFLVSLLMGVVGWVTYAYLYPHTPSGQMLIKYRPSTWSWRRGEARYTAAAIHSIHM